MQHEVHRRNTEHGVVRVKSRKCGACKMLPLLGGHGILIGATDVLRRRNQETCCSACRIANSIIWCRLQQLDHHLSNMLRGTELSVLACCSQLAEHVLIQVALHIQLCNIVLVQIIQPRDYFLKQLRGGDDEHRIAHIPCKSGRAFVCLAGFVFDLYELPLFIKIGEATILHAF